MTKNEKSSLGGALVGVNEFDRKIRPFYPVAISAFASRNAVA